MFYAESDRHLDYTLEEIKSLMNDALTQIAACEEDPDSEFNVRPLKRDIERFLEDW